MHFRSNTMFKLGYQAFILFSIVSGYTITNFLAKSEKRRGIRRKIFFIFLIPQLFLVSIYPIFSVRSYFGELKDYKGLDGTLWIQVQYPDDWKAITWLNNNGSPTSPAARGAIMTDSPVIIEADGDSYTDYDHFSAFTGIPTVVVLCREIPYPDSHQSFQQFLHSPR